MHVHYEDVTFFIHTKVQKKQVSEYTIAPCIHENSGNSCISPCKTVVAASTRTWIIILSLLQLVLVYSPCLSSVSNLISILPFLK